MPELPEVETTTQGLRNTIVGRTIKNAWTDLSTKDKKAKGRNRESEVFYYF